MQDTKEADSTDKSQASSKPDPAIILKAVISALISIASLPGQIIKKIDKVYLTPLSIIITGVMISGSILISSQGALKLSSGIGTQTPTSATTGSKPTTQGGYASAQNVESLKNSDYVRGNKKARILLIEYSDLECPFCKKFHPTAQQAVDQYKGQVAWVYRHFPLDPIHSKADKEAEAAECAGELGGQDAFWKFVDKVFEVTPSNNGLELAELPKIAGQVGLDQAKFKTCLDSGKYAAKVEEQYQGGVKAGITGTPGNILYDTKTKKNKLIPGAIDYNALKTQIDSLLNGS
ncbi:thioredoxin domain-containing protein [Candidatus Curtissbacteria bacterium]|nr:thioredoxin domain-containing protein [Candidatus Curtissbacteria bacterium]